MLLTMIKFVLTNVTMNLNKFALIVYLFHDIRCFLNADTSLVFHVSENIEYINLCLKRYIFIQFANNHAV